MPMTIARAFEDAEALSLADDRRSILLRITGLSFRLHHDGEQARWRDGLPMRTPRPIIAEFEYFPFGAPEDRSFTAIRGWLPEDPATVASPFFADMFRGHFRLRRRKLRPARQHRILRQARYSFETLHPGFEHLSVALEPERDRQKGSVTGPCLGMPVASSLLAEFTVDGLLAA